MSVPHGAVGLWSVIVECPGQAHLLYCKLWLYECLKMNIPEIRFQYIYMWLKMYYKNYKFSAIKLSFDHTSRSKINCLQKG